jgi:putative phosphoesterase
MSMADIISTSYDPHRTAPRSETLQTDGIPPDAIPADTIAAAAPGSAHHDPATPRHPTGLARATMLIGILSDTHGDALAARAALTILQAHGATFFIHCGDIGTPAVLDLLTGLPCIAVLGNNDAPSLIKYAKRLGIDCHAPLAEVTQGGKSIAIIHGDDIRLRRQLIQEQRHDYLFIGHTHSRSDDRHGRIRVINPGALYRTAVRGVAILDTQTDSLRFIDVTED